MKSKPQQLTYTLAPLSARSHNQHNHYDQISSATSTAQTRGAISPQQSLRPLRTKVPAEEAILQHSDLNTSGANTTICEYVKMLSTHDQIQSEDVLESLHSSWSEDYKNKIDQMRRNNEVRMGRREGVDQLMELQRFRKKNVKHNEQHQMLSKVMATAPPGRDDSATIIEFTDFVGHTEANHQYVDKENVPDKKREKLVIGKIIIPPKNKSPETKNCFQQSMISKIAGGSTHQQNNASSSTSASITARRLREEQNMNRSKGPETAVTVNSRLMTSRTERDNYLTQPGRSPDNLIRPLIQLTSPQLTKKSRRHIDAGYKSVMSHRNSHSSNVSSLQNPNKSLQKKFNPVPAPVSRSVQAIVTPRGQYYIQNDDNQKPLAPIKEEPSNKAPEKRANSKGDIKGKKDQKVMKATKIDLVEMDISRKSGQKRRNEKVEDCLESLEVVYGILKKTIKEKKEDISHSEQCIQKLEGLKDHMINVISAVNGLKAD